MINESLNKHIEQVCTAVLGSSNSYQISVYDEIEMLSKPTAPIAEYERTHEFLVVVHLSEEIKQCDMLLKRMRVFTGKDVLMKMTDTGCCLYWGEGESSGIKYAVTNYSDIDETHPLAKMEGPIDNVTWLKTETVLPAWLDKELFDVHQARYEPDWRKFEHNLDLTEDDLRVYLGTYFPRSYAEAFCIIDNLFQNNTYQRTWIDKKDVSILDIGCGCGGNLIGLITCIEKYCHSIKTINITVIDGNQFALNVLEKLIKAFATRTTKHIHFKPVYKKIKSISELPDFDQSQFDFIASFKMGCEIISKGKGLCDNAYYELLSKYADTLSKTGIFLLLDITTKTDKGRYYPQLMNRQVSNFNRNNTGHTSLVPIPCRTHETECREDCFTQKEFRVSHQKASSDHSKIAYRIIGRSEFAQQFHTAHIAAKYLICKKEGTTELGTCPHTADNKRILDAYKI